MKKILIILCVLLLSNCTYHDYTNKYSDIEIKEYVFKGNEPKKVKLHYKLPMSCSGGRSSVCSNKGVILKTTEIFEEYNLNPRVAKKGTDYPMLSIKSSISVDNLGIFQNIFSVLTLGIIPFKNQSSYSVEFSNKDYIIKHKEEHSSYTGWFMIPFANEYIEKDYLGNMMKATLNQAIKDDKLY